MHKKDLEIEINNFINRYVELEAKESTYSLEKADLISEAKERLPKRAWSKWLQDSRVRLKPSQAKKLIAISKMCKAGGQPTGLFQKEGVEKTYLIALVQDEELRQALIQHCLNKTISARELKKAINLIQEEGLQVEEAFLKAKEKPPQENKKQKNTVPLEQYQQVLNELLEIKERLKGLEQKPVEEEQKNKKAVLPKQSKNESNQRSDHIQESFLLSDC